MKYLVTVKLKKGIYHNPKSKLTGHCLFDALCTDVTGQHHTFVVVGSPEEFLKIEEKIRAQFHVTRVEMCPVEIDINNVDYCISDYPGAGI